MIELKSIEKPKRSRAGKFLINMGEQDVDENIVFSLDEWAAIDAEVRKLEHHIKRLLDGYSADNLTMQTVYRNAKEAINQ